MAAGGRFSKSVVVLYRYAGMNPSVQLITELNTTHMSYTDLNTLALQLLKRQLALDGTPVADAVGKLFADADSKMKPYKKADLDYDITCGWIVVVVKGTDVGAAEGLCSVAETLKELADDGQADSRSKLCEASTWGYGLFSVDEAAESEQRTFMSAVATQELSANLSKKGMLKLILNAQAYMAMCDIPWQKWLSTEQCEAILKAYKAEWDALLSTVL